MSDKNADLLQELLEIASDSRNFYRAAAAAVELPFLKNEFTHMADAKGVLVTELRTHIKARGEVPDSGGTLAGSLRQTYTDVLASLSQTAAATYTYAAQLEESEDRLLKHFDQALVETDSMAVRAVLLTELPKLRKSHDQMKQLKDTLAA
jgi:uncharacterized protein (TIGR02284 family)